MHRSLFIVLVAVLLAGSAWAVEVNVWDYCNNTGIRLSVSAKTVSLNQGQTATVGRVTRPAALAAKGLPGANTGDTVLVTYQGGKTFKLTHPASGREVVIQATWLP